MFYCIVFASVSARKWIKTLVASVLGSKYDLGLLENEPLLIKLANEERKGEI
jgi:hypothetical protein